jgi:predicted HicB family RNase H-like nuclease
VGVRERERERETMKSKQINTKTRLIRISSDLHRVLRINAARDEKSIKRWLEDFLLEHGVSEEGGE